MFTPWLRTRKRRQSLATSRRVVARQRHFAPRVEQLEDRCLLTAITLMVTTTADNGDNVHPTPGSLRQAIMMANANPGPGFIDFALGSGARTITPPTPLPAISNEVMIDGSSQAGFAGPPLITLAGPNAGLAVNGSNSQVRGLVITGSVGNGIQVGGDNILIAGNVIDNNQGDGILVLGNQNRIIGNIIGTDQKASQLLGNGGDGVGISGNDNTIGMQIGAVPIGGEVNVIAFNGGAGVFVGVGGTLAVDNSIRGNSIFGNHKLGIDLYPPGVTPNDPGDKDYGTSANNSQNFPVLGSAASGNAGTVVTFRLDSRPGIVYIIDFYMSPIADPSGYGQGGQFIGSVTAKATPGNPPPYGGVLVGSQTFSTLIPSNQFLTATATDPAGNTSEFSNALSINPHGPLTSNTAAIQLTPATANPAYLGQAITLVATVGAAASVTGTPTGTVTFLDGATPLGTVLLDASGTATFSPTLGLGQHPISAVYSGDANFSSSTSPVFTETINQFTGLGATSTSTVVGASPNPVDAGQTLTLTATVSASAGSVSPSGLVEFLDGMTDLGVATLVANQPATLTTTALAPGTHQITAVYGGLSSASASFDGSTSDPITLTVLQSPTTTVLSSSANPAIAGRPLTFTATVSAAFGTPGGTVTFTAGSTSLGTAPLGSNGMATLTTSLAAGSYAVVATYSGAADFSSSSSMPSDQIVRPPTPVDNFTFYVTALYQDVLQRAPDAAGLNAWVQQLLAGASLQGVAQGIWESPEHRGLEVDALYATYLHRAADADGRAGWTQALLSGMTETQVALGLVTSPEYLAEHSDTASYITALYNDGLGRSPDTASLAAWEQTLQQPGGATLVARGIITSTEAYTRLLDSYYIAYLRRGADASGLQSWLDDLQIRGATPASVAEGILTSDEYFSLATA